MKSLVVVVLGVLRAVIFDLDGVIMKFKIDSYGIKREVIAHLEEKGVTPNALSPSDPFSRIKEGAETALASMGRGDAWIEAVMREAEGIPVRHEVEAAKVAEVLPGARETLDALKGRGLRLAIFTYNNSLAVDIALAKNNLKGYFQIVSSRDSVPKPKPNPLHLEAVLKGLMVGRDEAVVIGDSEMDIKPCKELGVRVVAISTGVRSADFLRGLNPDYLIGSLPELNPIVDLLSRA